MKLGEFRKATNHLDDNCEVRILNDLGNLFSDVYTSRVVIVNDGLLDQDEEQKPPKVLIK